MTQQPKQQYDAFILAGGNSPWLKPLYNVGSLILAPLGGKRVIDRLLTTLKASGRIRTIVIATTKNAMAALEGTLPEGVLVCEASDSLPSTCLAAANLLGEAVTPKILGICDDIPLVTPEGLNDFLDQCERFPTGQMYYPLIPKDACLKAFPEAHRTFGTVTDGTFTGGNMMLIECAVIPRTLQKGREIYALRKSPFKLANWLGWSFILRAITRSLSVAMCEERFSTIMGTESHAIITQYAEIGMDIDKKEDIEAAEAYLKRRRVLDGSCKTHRARGSAD